MIDDFQHTCRFPFGSRILEVASVIATFHFPCLYTSERAIAISYGASNICL